MSRLCPICNTPISSVNLDELQVKAHGTTWLGVSYSCPHCLHVLTVGIDPIALKAEVVGEIVDKLRGR